MHATQEFNDFDRDYHIRILRICWWLVIDYGICTIVVRLPQAEFCCERDRLTPSELMSIDEMRRSSGSKT